MYFNVEYKYPLYFGTVAVRLALTVARTAVSFHVICATYMRVHTSVEDILKRNKGASSASFKESHISSPLSLITTFHTYTSTTTARKR